MALTKQDLADILTVIKAANAAAASTPERTPESLRREAKAQALQASTHKSKRFAYYIAGSAGAYVGGKLYRKGELIQYPVDKLPSYTWKATDERGKALAEAKAKEAEAAAEELAKLARDDDDETPPLDETEEPEADDGDEDEADEEAPPAKKPAPKPAVKKAAPPAKKPGKTRAADQDVA